MKKLITHDGSFHTDDIFAAATLSIYLQKIGETFEIIRTRDEGMIDGADYVFDVGGVYNEKNNRFDHHQASFKEKRKNGIYYSSFGLVWKKFGAEIVGKSETASLIEQKLVMPVDANDNGVDLCKNNLPDVSSYNLQDVFSTFSPTALEDTDKDKQFMNALAWAKQILEREIKKANDRIEITKTIRGFYENTKDKRLIVIDKPRVSRFEIWDALQDFSEPFFVVYGDNDDWSAVAMRKDKNVFGNRKDFPKTWGGLKKEELQKVTGVRDAVFCHNNLFFLVAKSKEGAIKLAELALLEPSH